MHQKNIKIFHFHNGTGGGVLSVIRNLIAFQQNADIESHVIFTINTDEIKNFKMPLLKGVESSQVFYYNSQWNFYHTTRQLAKLLIDRDCILIAHDWLELGMVSNLGLNNPVVHVLHIHLK